MVVPFLVSLFWLVFSVLLIFSSCWIWFICSAGIYWCLLRPLPKHSKDSREQREGSPLSSWRGRQTEDKWAQDVTSGVEKRAGIETETAWPWKECVCVWVWTERPRRREGCAPEVTRGWAARWVRGSPRGPVVALAHSWWLPAAGARGFWGVIADGRLCGTKAAGITSTENRKTVFLNHI